MKRRRVVDAVAEIADHMALAPQGGDDAGLLGRRNPAETRRVVDAGKQSLLGHGGELQARQRELSHLQDRAAVLPADVQFADELDGAAATALKPASVDLRRW